MICPRIHSQQAAEMGFETGQSEPRACCLKGCKACGLSPPPTGFYPYSSAFLFYMLEFWVPFSEKCYNGHNQQKMGCYYKTPNPKGTSLREETSLSPKSADLRFCTKAHPGHMTGKAKVAFSNASALSREHTHQIEIQGLFEAVTVTAGSPTGSDKRGSAFQRTAICLRLFEGEAIAQSSGNKMRFRVRVLIPLLPGCMMQF